MMACSALRGPSGLPSNTVRSYDRTYLTYALVNQVASTPAAAAVRLDPVAARARAKACGSIATEPEGAASCSAPQVPCFGSNRCLGATPRSDACSPVATTSVVTSQAVLVM